MIKGALLSLLSKQPKYGYLLKVEFEKITASAWPLNIGQVYTTLSRLERDELVRSIGEDSEARPLYEITEAGKSELKKWYQQPVERIATSRDELTLKVLLAAATNVCDPEDTIANQRQQSMRKLQEYTIERRTTTDFTEQLHTERLILHLKAELQWLDLAEELMANTQARESLQLTLNKKEKGNND